ncbi:DUF6502 family protein [Rhizobium hainanense]|nr:DUF6502 family protein [Rhizobium hainanense]
MKQQRPRPVISDAALQRMLGKVLKPFVRLSLASGLTFPAFATILKRLYVDVAEKEYGLPGKKQTDSRISLITGIHRKDVSKLRVGDMPLPAPPPPVSRTSRIIARWLADARYLDEEGTPRALPRIAENGAASFETLVEDVTRDLRPRAVLDEWLNRGIATLDIHDRVHLGAAAIVPDPGDSAKEHFFARNIHDHASAAVLNMLSADPAFFERAVHYDNISLELAKKLNDISRVESMDLLVRLNRLANEEVKADKGGQARWITGVYIFTEAKSDMDLNDVEDDQ